MPKIAQEPKNYKHQQLMNEINKMNICLKIHLYDIGDEETKRRHPKPTVQEYDLLQSRIRSILEQESSPMRRY